MNELIQANYDTLAQIAQRFQQTAENNIQLHTRLTTQVGQLRQAGWEGHGATAFFQEMDRGIFPIIQRLTASLEQSSATTLEAIRVLQEAEQAAVHLFGQDGSGIGLGGLIGQQLGIDAWNAIRDGNSLLPTPMDPYHVFRKEYMDEMVGRQIQGAGDPHLIDAMRTLSGNPTSAELDQALNQIASARGMSSEEVRAHYEKYLALREEAQRIGEAKGKPIPELNEFWHPNYMGSTPQLRYGQVVGNILGIDPVFGAMLNPTGGIVGSGNGGLPFVVLPEHPLTYHGVFHDAAGYLYNYHEVGPGYDYLNAESRDTSSPLAGQESGIAYWNEKMGAGRIESIITNGVGATLGGFQDFQTWIDSSMTYLERGLDSMRDVIQGGAGGLFRWAF